MADLKDDERWIVSSRAKVGRFFGVTASAVTTWVNQGMPCNDNSYDLRKIVDWKIDRVRQQIERSIDDPMAIDENTPSLEVWRKHKAELARLDVEERKGSLVNLDKVHEFLNVFSNRLRDYGDVLQRNGHTEAYKGLQDVLQEMATDAKAGVDGLN